MTKCRRVAFFWFCRLFFGRENVGGKKRTRDREGGGVEKGKKVGVEEGSREKV